MRLMSHAILRIRVVPSSTSPSASAGPNASTHAVTRSDTNEHIALTSDAWSRLSALVWAPEVPDMVVQNRMADDAVASAAHAKHLAKYLPRGVVAHARVVDVPWQVVERVCELAGKTMKQDGLEFVKALLLPDYANPPPTPSPMPRQGVTTWPAVVTVEIKPKRGQWPRPFPQAPVVERAFLATHRQPSTRHHRRLGTPLYFMRECTLAQRAGNHTGADAHADVTWYDPRDFFHGTREDVAHAVERLLSAHESHAGGDAGAGRHARIHVRGAGMHAKWMRVQSAEDAVRVLVPGSSGKDGFVGASAAAAAAAAAALADPVSHAIHTSGVARGLLHAQRLDALGSHAAATALESLIESTAAASTSTSPARLVASIRKYLVAACASDVSILVALRVVRKCKGSTVDGYGDDDGDSNSDPSHFEAWRDAADWMALPPGALASIGGDPTEFELHARVSVIDCDHKPLRKIFEHRKRDAEGARAWLRHVGLPEE